MKQLLMLSSCALFSLNVLGQVGNKTIAIIPEPVQIIQNKGSFVLPKSILLQVPKDTALQTTVNFLQQRLSKATGYTITKTSVAGASSIELVLNKNKDTVLGNEGYRLSITPSKIVLQANKAAGLFYGVQTLLQLLPKEIESDTLMRDVKWEAPCVTITDYPRFGWRGLMLDVSRHFFTKQEVKDFIDQMVRYKYNLLHWHLTDDEGWRIQIKSLPALTEKGAWRVDKTGYFGTFSAPLADEPLNYGGFYTQEDIKEVVQYAKDRFVNIMPEVDVPGHSLAAITAYPDLACTPTTEKTRVRSGEKIMDWHGDGTFTALVDNNLCPANEAVYTFLDKVFTEVAQLFPFDYIHVGGDECAKNFWEQTPSIKMLMQKDGLKNMEEVQGYFEKRVEKIILSKGKKMMGWDEILEGGVAPSAAIMSWRGEKGGKEAAAQKHEVVMSPTTYAYLDYMQGDVGIEPKVYATLRLNKAYQFDPVPEGVNAQYIKGGQANIWTEQMPNMRHLQYMLWPRALAIAECVWTPKANKNWARFVPKVEAQFKRFHIQNINYAPSIYDAIITPKNMGGQLSIELATEIEGLDIHYSFDNSFPDQFYPSYKNVLTPPKDAMQLRIITYRNNEPTGRMMTIPLEDLRKRAGIKKEL